MKRTTSPPSLSVFAIFVVSLLALGPTMLVAQNAAPYNLPHVTTRLSTDAFIFQPLGSTKVDYQTRAELFSGYALTSSPSLSWAIYASDYGVAPTASVATNDSGIAAALAALPTAGGVVFLPCGALNISATITLGDATTSAASTRNGISLLGCGQGPDGINLTAVSGATRIVWAGSAGGTMLATAGPIEGIHLADFTLDGAGTAYTIIHSYRAFRLSAERMTLMHWTGTALAIDADGTYTGAGGGGGAGAPFGQTWKDINIVNPSATTAGAVAIGANAVCTCNVNNITFLGSTLERGSANTAVGVWLGNTDHDRFISTFVLQRGSTTGKAVVVASQAGATGFPANIEFLGSPIIGGVFQDNSAATWVGGGSPALIFEPFYTIDSQAIPPVGANGTTLAANLVGGTTDRGTPLSGWQQATLSSAPGLSANQAEFGLNGILFNGATPDSNQTLLTVVDPTADRTLTLPNVSGTIITTGDSGTVTDAMEANAYSGVGACGANTWASTLTRNAAPTCTQPGFSNLSGTATAAQTPLAAILGGVSGGQTLNGDTASGGNLTLSSTANATKGKILFGTSAYDHANNRLGIGTSSPDVQLTISGNAAAIPASPATTRFHLAGADAESATRMMIDVFGIASTPVISGRKSRGTAASPSAVQAGDILLQIEGLGYQATQYSTTSRAATLFEASQAWTDSVQGTRETHYLTPTGGTSNVNVWRVDGDSHVTTTQATAPTVSCTGTGTSPSAPTVDGTDHAFRITINTGTGSPGSTGTCTVTFKTAYATNAPILVCSLVSGATAWGNGATIQETTESASAPILTFTNLVGGVATALTTSTSYKVNCIAIGR